MSDQAKAVPMTPEEARAVVEKATPVTIALDALNGEA